MVKLAKMNVIQCCCIPNQDGLDQSDIPALLDRCCQEPADYQIWFNGIFETHSCTETCAEHLKEMLDDSLYFEILRIEAAI